MRNLSCIKGVGLLLVIVLLLSLAGFAACKPPAPPAPPPAPPKPTYTPTMTVSPAGADLAATLLATPVKFEVKGFAPGESLFVELVMARPGHKLGSDLPVAFGRADASGNAAMTMDTTVKAVEILAKDSGIQPKEYTVRATGLTSGASALGKFTFTTPAPAPPK